MIFSVAGHASGLERVLMPGEVVAAHAKTEANCSACHQTFEKDAQPSLCVACHKEVGADIRSKQGFHGRAAAAVCRTCHTDHKGRNADIVKLDTKTFRHDQTDFRLVGVHLTTACTECHLAGKKYRQAPSSCVACHRKDDKHKASLGDDCANCHRPSDWKQVNFDHGTTGFALRGKHASATCASCHKQPLGQVKLATDCIGCHKGDDVHRGTMGASCADCHNERDWKQARFDHSKTGFALLGMHLQADCSGCHRQPNVFTGASSDCFSCHKAKDVHEGTLGKDCKGCHQAQAWKPARGFDHSRTRYPLLGKHRQAACLGCHTGLKRFTPLASACVDCHRKDDTHKGRNGLECGSCHNAASWKTSSFDHSKATKFPLLGGHGKLACESCHKGDLHKDKLQMSCISCHREKDPHRGKLGESCERCHDAESWTRVQVDHALAGFPLLGQHRTVSCRACHADQVAWRAPILCVGCHVKNDIHEGRLGKKCETCHNSRNWLLWDFNHSTRTKFALTGAHKALECEQCHNVARGNAVAVSSSCGTCHIGDDVHNGSFGNRCEKCHTTISFKGVVVSRRQ